MKGDIASSDGQRGAYRRRRIGDAARLLPLLGVFLFIMPLLWSNGEEGVLTSDAMFYIFGTWAILTFVARIISGYLASDPSSDLQDGDK